MTNGQDTANDLRDALCGMTHPGYPGAPDRLQKAIDARILDLAKPLQGAPAQTSPCSDAGSVPVGRKPVPAPACAPEAIMRNRLGDEWRRSVTDGALSVTHRRPNGSEVQFKLDMRTSASGTRVFFEEANEAPPATLPVTWSDESGSSWSEPATHDQAVRLLSVCRQEAASARRILGAMSFEGLLNAATRVAKAAGDEKIEEVAKSVAGALVVEREMAKKCQSCVGDARQILGAKRDEGLIDVATRMANNFAALRRANDALETRLASERTGFEQAIEGWKAQTERFEGYVEAARKALGATSGETAEAAAIRVRVERDSARTQVTAFESHLSRWARST